MKSLKNSNDRFIFSLLVAAQVLFGVHYIASKVLLAQFPPLVWASIRSVVAAALFVLVSALMRKLNVKKAIKLAVPLITFAMLSTCLNQALFLSGLQHTTAANASILNTLIPVITLFFVVLTGREKLDVKQGLGFFIAFAGAMLLMGFESFSFTSQHFLGDSLTLLNVVSYSLFLVFSRPFLRRHAGLWATTWMFVYGSIGLVFASLPSWEMFVWPYWDHKLIACAIFAIVGGTFLPYLFINYALARTEASKVALFVYIQPVVASIAGWIWLNQAPTSRTLVSGILVFAGVALSSLQARQAKRTEVRTPHKKAA